ncbi:MAG: lipopolysaccharide heptosyltransferase II [Desulfurivibrio sp.]|nr:lipopolysaccharide heptosyltransferase II [Desulfurivibrio sp.]
MRQRRPKSVIDVIAPPWSLPLLARMPEVRRALPLAVAHGELAWRKRWGLGKSLRPEKYIQAIILPRTLKSALPPLVAGIPRRTGYLGEFRYGLLNDIRPLEQKLYRTVDRYLNLGLEPAEPLPAPAPEPRLRISEESRQQAARHLNLGIDGAPVLALCPGAEYGSAKRWPVEHFAEVARDRLQAGWQIWLLGSERDRPVTGAIATAAPGSIDLAGQTSLAQAVDLLSLASAAISNDSGLMHVAAAVGVPVIALYGSSDPHYTPPLSRQSHSICLGLSCSPCFRSECPLGHLDCLQQITPQQVLSLLPATAGAHTNMHNP